MAARVGDLETAGILYGVLTGVVPMRMALQPIVDMRSGRAIGHEALFRVEGRPGLDPAALWGEASRTGVLEELEDLTARACKALLPLDGRLFVNVDPRSTRIVERWARTPGVVLELTEAARVPIGLVSALEDAGIPYALDDVGVGEANFASLVRMRPQFLKVDRSLVAGCDRDERKAAFLAALVAYAQRVGVRLIAEGVEARGEMALLLRLGVDYGQGFYFGRPVA
ncbi:MAG: EAL domain-containing protein [Firmicutes bacterium]|nr:EAL domain-containing protein [Bacillota bacterium]